MQRIYGLVFAIMAVFTTKANDTIVVRKDARLDILTAKQLLINKRSAMMTSGGLYKGYRVQVASTPNREEAFKVKTDLLNRFPDQKTYLVFQSPYFKVRIGNFLKRDDADKFRKQINKIVTIGTYIVEDAIEYKSADPDEIIPQ